MSALKFSLSLQPWQVPASKVHTPDDWDTILAELHVPDEKAEGLTSQGSVVLDEAVKAELAVKVEPGDAGKPVKEQRKALTLKERLEVCQATERQRLSFCKVCHFSFSCIGLFLKGSIFTPCPHLCPCRMPHLATCYTAQRKACKICNGEYFFVRTG